MRKFNTEIDLVLTITDNIIATTRTPTKSAKKCDNLLFFILVLLFAIAIPVFVIVIIAFCFGFIRYLRFRKTQIAAAKLILYKRHQQIDLALHKQSFFNRKTKPDRYRHITLRGSKNHR